MRYALPGRDDTAVDRDGDHGLVAGEQLHSDTAERSREGLAVRPLVHAREVNAALEARIGVERGEDAVDRLLRERGDLVEAEERQPGDECDVDGDLAANRNATAKTASTADGETSASTSLGIGFVPATLVTADAGNEAPSASGDTEHGTSSENVQGEHDIEVEGLEDSEVIREEELHEKIELLDQAEDGVQP